MRYPQPGSILLVLPIMAFRSNGAIFIDRQACNGMRLWLDNFERVTLACLSTDSAPPNMTEYSSINELDRFNHLQFSGLPDGYTPWRSLKELPHVARGLSALIDQSEHLHFAIGGLWGDWGSVAAIISSIKKRPFAVWTDRVESKVVLFDVKSHTGIKRQYLTINAFLMPYYERFVIGLSSMGLFHGMDCFEAYSPYSSNPQLVHDIHLGPDEAISNNDLEARYASSTDTLRIVYAGRAHREKGIFDWIETLKLAHNAGVRFDATWYGDGPDKEEAISAASDMQDFVHFPGSVADHKELIAKLKGFDLFLFCHKTPESPRCLIEALICGLPIVGYDSPYPRELISGHGGGILTALHKPAGLANAIIGFASNKRELTGLAAKDGLNFNDENVFMHRSDLMRSITRTNAQGQKLICPTCESARTITPKFASAVVPGTDASTLEIVCPKCGPSVEPLFAK